MSRPLAAAIALSLTWIGVVGFAPPRAPCGESHLVVRGDTLGRIARRCGATVAAIARASGVANPDLIRVGQRLTIPGRAHGVSASRPAAPAPPAGYAMARGDTLFSLARWAGVGLPDLLAANPGIDPRSIEIGDRIRLPAGARDPVAARSRERRAGLADVRPSAIPATSRRTRPDRPPAPRAQEREPIGM